MKTDLNLLRVFDVLMEVRSVTRAADRLGLTQSAVSHALARLREQIGDPLFVRSGGGLRPTPRAAEIAPVIRDGLSQLRDALSPAEFDPLTTTREFTVSAGSYFCTTLLPVVVQRARAEAPGARFSIVAPGADLLSALEEGSLDLALGGYGRYPDRFRKDVLFVERLVWIGRAGGGTDIAARPRLALASRQARAETGETMFRNGLEQRLNVVPHTPFPQAQSPVAIHDPLSAGALVAGSDLVTLLPRQLARMMSARGGVEIIGPDEGSGIEMAMLWHGRAAADPAHIWLRGLVSAAALRLS